jgi:WD40 repeat protein
MTLRIWDSFTGTMIHSSKYLDAGVLQMAMIMDVAPNGEYVATGQPDQSTKVFSTSDGERLVRWNKKRANQLRFSPDGSRLACAIGKNIECFRTGDWTSVSTLSGHTSKVHLLEYSPDGRTLVSAAGKYVKLWDTTTGKLRTTLEGHTKLLGSMAISSDSSFLATVGEDLQLMLWSLPKGQTIPIDSACLGRVADVAISPDNKTIAIVDMEGKLRLWRLGSTDTSLLFQAPWIRHMAFAPNGKHLAFIDVYDESVRLHDTKSGKLVATLPDSVDLAWSPSGDWLASADKYDIVLWDTAKKSRKAK